MISNREHQILQLISDGYTSKEIAAKLYISTETVHSHRKSIQQKLRASNTARMIAHSFYYGILSVNQSFKPLTA